MDSVSRKLRQFPRFAEGRIEAEAAIANGTLAFRFNGSTDRPAFDAARATLLTRYGLELFLDEHSITPPEKAARDEGFNERMREEFVARFGQDVVSLVFREAERERRKVP